MSRFSDLYWSSDYKTGIDLLGQQSLRSIHQLHELKQLVFNYMNYYHSNSEYLNKLSVELYPPDSKFRPSSTGITSLKTSDKGLTLIHMGSAFDAYVASLSTESHTFLRLASAIDREVLEKITAFIKFHESRIRATVDEFENLFSDYESTYKKVEKLKDQYSECVRLNEFSNNSHVEEQIDEPEATPDIPETTTKPVEVRTIDSKFQFPLSLGSISVATSAAFTELIQRLIGGITTTKRKIPLPGYRNELFSSDQLCDFVIKNRAFGINPTRVNLERFGQALIDLKLIISTAFLSANKFKSEGMWFEWTDLAIFVSEYDGTVPEPVELKEESKEESKFINDMAETTKRFNGIFKSVRTSFMKNNYAIQVVELEEKYNESYYELQQYKHFLDVEIFNKSQMLESFEKTKIEIVYQSLTKLLEIIYNFSLASTNGLHKVATEFMENLNKPENYERDFDILLNHYSTGIYFPSIVSPDNLTKKHFSTQQSNNNFQNLKREFNLYKDILLQVQNGSSESLLSIASIPQFLYSLIKLIEEKQEELEISKFWQSPLNHQDYWLVKELLIKTINRYEPSEEPALESTVHAEILEQVCKNLDTRPVQSLINFLKNWFLEISDSVIPCLVYDSLVNHYKEKGDKKDIEELIKILGTIPRSNLSSLTFVLEHVSGAFGLSQIPCYEFSDDLPEGLEEKTDEIKLKQAREELNSMDTIGSIPFVHLILRPSTVKNSSGFKPPLEMYSLLLNDLLDISTRMKLFQVSVANEKKFKTKKENEKIGLGLKKLPSLPPQQSLELPSVNISKTNKSVVNGTVPKSPRPMSGESFTLRPFRTKATPNPSPTNSPRHTPKNSVDWNKKRDSTEQQTRPRSTSSTFLTPNIEVEFEEA